jgi:hypothetical protein
MSTEASPGEATEPVEGQAAADTTNPEGEAAEPSQDAGGEQESAADEWLTQFDANNSTNYAEKYATVDEFAKGMHHAAKSLAGRDQEAAAWRALAGKVPAEQLTALYQTGKLPEQPETAPAKVKEGRPDNHWDPSYVVTDPSTGRLVKADHAPADYQERYRAHQQYLASLPSDLPGMIEAKVAAAMAPLQESIDNTRAETQQQTADREWQAMEQELRDVLYIGGDRAGALTTTGEAVKQLLDHWHSDASPLKVTDDALALREAVKHVTESQPALRGAKSPSPKSKRQAGSSEPAPDNRTMAQLLQPKEEGGEDFDTFQAASEFMEAQGRS